jgi:hypothetical protein
MKCNIQHFIRREDLPKLVVCYCYDTSVCFSFKAMVVLL